MTELATKYIANKVEQHWYQAWMQADLFHSQPDDREPFTVVIPPPNVTGVLHMGHMLNETIQDVLCRKARMEGKNVCWVPGTDHASIATEAKVVNLLETKGIKKQSLTREEFLKYAWQWKEEKGGIILEQLKKLGCCCDWQRTKFTMDDDMSKAVVKVFCDLYDKGLIYRGVRMVNWDPKALTAVSDEEVIYKEQHSKLYYLKYYIENQNDYVVVATTRPETIMGDTAVCINPNDERYKHLKGKRLRIPIVDRYVPVIEDEYVDMSFGTGALKITPAHDINDYNIGITHKLDSINIFNDNGTLNENGLAYKGLDRFVCRKQIVKDLQECGLIEKIEDYDNKIGVSERTQEIIEPKLSMQWFVKMESLAKPALQVVEDNTIKFHPEKFKNTYRHWMENVKDWCISRQLWWGHRIPAYYLPNKEFVVCETIEGAVVKANERYNQSWTKEDLKQDEDVLDTWFSSWLWPISCFDGILHPDNKEINYYYPTSDLITAPDIMFFWVARMIMAGLEYRKDIPFKNVYFTGTVRDKLGRKMSKTLGNSPDALALIDKYGADGVRMGMLIVSPAGGDILFDESYCEQGRNFTNKIWNALRLIKGFQVKEDLQQEDRAKIAIDWFRQRMNVVINQTNDDFSKYRLSECLKNIYSFIWDDFCSWLLEIVKPEYQHPIDKTTYDSLLDIFEDLMKIIHPFMPFVSEEIYHQIKTRDDNDFIMNCSYPKATSKDNPMDEEFCFIKEIITGVRSLRNTKNISPKQGLDCYIKSNENEDVIKKYKSIIIKLANLNSLSFVNDKMDGVSTLMVRTTEIFIPINQSINKEEELQKIKQQLDYYNGFKLSIEKKLSNEKFVNNAPEKVVALERKKLSDCISKINALNDELNTLNK